VSGEEEAVTAAAAAGVCWSSSWSSSSHLWADKFDAWRRDSIHSWAVWSLGAASVKSRDDVNMANATFPDQRRFFEEEYCVVSWI